MKHNPLQPKSTGKKNNINKLKSFNLFTSKGQQKDV